MNDTNPVLTLKRTNRELITNALLYDIIIYKHERSTGTDSDSKYCSTDSVTNPRNKDLYYRHNCDPSNIWVSKVVFSPMGLDRKFKWVVDFNFYPAQFISFIQSQ